MRQPEAEQDRPPGLAEPVHLAQHVAEDVGEREQERAAVGDDRAELDQLRRADVGDQQQAAEQHDDEVVVARPSGCAAASGGRRVGWQLGSGRHGVIQPAFAGAVAPLRSTTAWRARAGLRWRHVGSVAAPAQAAGAAGATTHGSRGRAAGSNRSSNWCVATGSRSASRGSNAVCVIRLDRMGVDGDAVPAGKQARHMLR